MQWFSNGISSLFAITVLGIAIQSNPVISSIYKSYLYGKAEVRPIEFSTTLRPLSAFVQPGAIDCDVLNLRADLGQKIGWFARGK